MEKIIVVVEDDKAINEVVSEYMKDAGYTVVSHGDGASALEYITSGRPVSLFILDILLPGVGGLDLLRSVRGSDMHGSKPVVMLTALGDEATQLLSFDTLADDYIVKPFSPKILVRRVNALLRRTETGKNILRFGGVTLDFDRYEVSDLGEPVSLTVREIELLAALMSSEGRVMSRQQLLDRAWGYDYFGDERIVDVHIKNLRKKLSGNIIQTVKGIGYKLCGDSSADGAG